VVHVGRLPNFLMQDPGVVGPDCKLYGELERESRERLRRRAIAGSVSDYVVGHSRCPVLVVSPGARRGSSMGRFEAAG
jgi:Universal stress protein family